MVVIAIAGGTGGVGRTIVDTLTQEPGYEVIVLTRKPTTISLLEKSKQVEVNYADVAALVQVLEQYAVHTIISAISLFSDDTSQAQLNLIRAAEQSSFTKRFMPSEYSYIQTAVHLDIDPGIQYFVDAANLLRKGHLMFTRVIPGFFMDYWGMPNVRTNLSPMTFGIDMASCQAAIPGDGNDKISMTYTYDMAKFIVKLLELDDWPEFSIVVGDVVTYNQLLELAEKVRGTKFQVVYDSAEKIKEGQVTVPPMPPGVEYSNQELQEMTVLVSRLTIAKVFDFPVEQRLNSRFPELKLLTVEELLDNAWKETQ